MKVTVNSAKLANVFQILTSVIPLQSSLPILQNIKMEVHNTKQIDFFATNLDTSIKYTLDCAENGIDVIEPGMVVISGHKIFSLLKETSHDILTLSKEEDGVHLTGTSGNYKLAFVDPQDYPDIPPVEKQASFEIMPAEALTAINRVSFAVSHDTAKYNLTGMLFNVDAKYVDIVATDGRRLARERIKNDSSTTGKNQVIVPVNVLKIVAKIISPNSKTPLTFVLGENQIKIIIDNVEIYSRLIDGKFPDYEDVIPKKFSQQAVINRKEFISALRRSEIFATKESKSVTLQFEPAKMIISSRSVEVGEAQVALPVNFTGETEFAIVFNPDFILEVLNVMEDEEVTFELIDPRSAGRVQIGKNYTYVFMPLNPQQ